MERRLSAEADTRPLVVLDPRAPGLERRARRGGARDRLAARATRARRRLRAAAARRPAADGSTRRCGVAAGARAPRAARRPTRPGLTAAQNRRGLVVYVAARGPSTARRAARRTPGRLRARRARRAAGPPRRCSRSPAATATIGAGARARRRRDGGRGGLSATLSARPLRGPRRLPRPRAAAARLARRGRARLALPRPRGFGALHWMAMLEPAAPRRAWLASSAARLAIARPASAGAAARAAPARPRRGRIARGVRARAAGRRAARTSCCARRLGRARVRLGRGIAALPGARVPYRGVDEWTRLVIALGGTVLAGARRRCSPSGRARRPSASADRRARAARALYASRSSRSTPAASSSAARCALLVVAFLRLERLRRRDDGVAAAMLAGAALLGLVAAPALDTDQPWFDYETWAIERLRRSRRASPGTTLRAAGLAARRPRAAAHPRASEPAYWKAATSTTSTAAAGARPAPRPTGRLPDVRSPRRTAALDLQEIRVTVRNLRTADVHRRGSPARSSSRRPAALPGDGTYASTSRELRRGDAYRARVYTPNPNASERTAGPHLPGFAERYPRWTCPRRRGASPGPDGRRRLARLRVQFPLFGGPGAPKPVPPFDRGYRDESARRCCALALRAHLRARAAAAREPRRPTTSCRPCCATCSATVHLHRVAAARRRDPRRLPVRRQVRLLPAVLGRDGAAAAHGRRARARLDRLHDRPARPQGAASTSCATVDAHSWVEVCTPRLRLGDVGPDAGRRARRARRPTTRPPTARRRPAGRTSAATSATDGDAAAPAAHGRRGRRGR